MEYSLFTFYEEVNPKVAQQELDVRGEICPYTLINTRGRMEELDPGDRLEVLIDYPLARENIPRWAEEAGHKIVANTETETSEWKLILEKSSENEE